MFVLLDVLCVAASVQLIAVVGFLYAIMCESFVKQGSSAWHAFGMRK